MLRFAPPMMAVFLCGAALSGCASDAAKLSGDDSHAKKVQSAAADKDLPVPTDLEGGIRQAQTMRLAGHYDDAIHVLSQLMLVASDDPRVVSEYGKALAEKGRAQDAVEFLSRAIELSGNDWTLYSALGVAYDQLGNQTAATTAYEHALKLHPEEPSVLNNYALSRMLAGDSAGAHTLMARAQAAGGASDSKIAANIAMINKLGPAQDVAAAQPAHSTALAANAPTPFVPVAQQALPNIAQTAPRSILPQQKQQTAPNNGVVMQQVPVDPLAGPVKAHVAKPAPSAIAKTDIKKDDTKQTAAKAATDSKPADAKPVTKIASAKPAAKDKTADAKSDGKDKVPALRLTADARSP